MTASSSSPERARGFTLVEIAIAIFIIALLLGSILVPLTTQVEQRQVSETQKMLEDIKEALIGHAVAKGYLPCPDRTAGGAGTTYDTANDGVEDYNTGTGVCFSTTATGNVPWVTLGVGASDPWGNRFRYRVHSSYAQRSPAAIFNLTTGTNLTVTATSGGALLTAASPDGAVAVIISHGKNRYGGINSHTGVQIPCPAGGCSVDEQDNLLGGTSYTSRTHTVFANPCGGAGEPLCEFDDVVTWVGKYTLFNRMVAAGKLP
ncbi:MAG TPA: prepilin-type N-terminal cleavage/methylation domain-containing protein [Burkholderiales bacterium]